MASIPELINTHAVTHFQCTPSLASMLMWDPDAREDGLTNCMTFISGPSKTADVEATMVHGAHGPREVYVYVITT